MDDRKNIGALGESVALEFLKSKGLKILARNFCLKGRGEIDIIAQENNEIVFVEVKTRTSYNFGRGEESVNHRKIRQLIRVAEYYMMTNRLANSWRIDVLGIDLDKTGDLKRLRWYKNIEI